MTIFYDIYAVGLLTMSIGLFLARYGRSDPPISPYLTIICACAVARWVGAQEMHLAALVLLTAAGFLYVACLAKPDRAQWREEARAFRRLRPPARPVRGAQAPEAQ
ncbi:XrtV sorting system accessory protein [Amphiplicatus metriothermophilus]|uniref:Uncharacterized protein n=1 Tax=Amphiplicatus metriothermophilus TaxID=1519374 RepID=A0A239PUL8_9PROT|nr:XrtV sorting system accessory protein [Amphiplicatus metriothermophilus]MBB5519308.1 hypothetical protein [Amphiplicatus metriothermophilus]SNT73377.1 hypothetical protein SAMN06297382_1776 [Amphiplicatus metriothermophilus]